MGGVLALILLGSSWSGTVFADQAYVYGWLGGYSKVLRATNSSVADNGLTGAYNASASVGRVRARVYPFPAAYPYNYGYADGSGSWDDTITIQPDNPALLGTSGTAVFTYYLNGSASVIDYQQVRFSVSTECGCGGPSTYGGTPIVSSFPIVRTFTFGTPFQILMGLESFGAGYSANNMDVSLTAGGMVVTDGGNHPAAYTSASSTGAGRSVVLTNGNAYAGFSLTNTVGNQTAAALLAGMATATNETPVAQFTASHGTNGIVSDVLDFSGTGTNLFALQMSYNPLAAVAQLGGELKTALQYFDPVAQIWTNAVFGNSDGGTNNLFFAAAFDLGKFVLGNWGVDTNAHSVWECWTTTAALPPPVPPRRRRCAPLASRRKPTASPFSCKARRPARFWWTSRRT